MARMVHPIFAIALTDKDTIIYSVIMIEIIII